MSRPLYDITALDFADRAYDIYRRMRDEQPLYAVEPGHEFTVSATLFEGHLPHIRFSNCK